MCVYPWDRDECDAATPEIRLASCLAWTVPLLFDYMRAAGETDDPHFVAEITILAANTCAMTAAILLRRYDDAERIFDQSQAIMDSWRWARRPISAPEAIQ